MTIGARVGPAKKKKTDDVWEKSNNSIAAQALRWTDRYQRKGLTEEHCLVNIRSDMEQEIWTTCFSFSWRRTGVTARHIGW